MKTTTKTSISAIIMATLGLSLAGAHADAVSKAIGFNKVTCDGDADTLVSVPFHLKPAHVGLVDGDPTDTSSGSVEAGEDIIITLDGTTFGDDTLVGTHYVRIRSGAKDGFYYEIAANTATTITLSSNGDDLTGIVDGTQISVIPHNTLGNLFPNGDGVHPSASGFVRRTEVFIPSTTLGINKGAQATYFYNDTAGEWQSFPPSGNKDSVVVPPNQVLIIRHNLPDSTQICFYGRVPNGTHAVQIDIGTGKNDVFYSIDRPIPVSLRDSGLGENGDFEVSANLFVRKDELYVFVPGEKNPGALKTYVLIPPTGAGDSGWRAFPNAADDVGDDLVFQPGEAVVIRKAAAGSEATVFGLNSPTY